MWTARRIVSECSGMQGHIAGSQTVVMGRRAHESGVGLHPSAPTPPDERLN